MAVEGEKQEIEQQLERAVCTRLQHFKDQADSLTLASVRRLLEKDLGLEKFALDVHKTFIKQYMEKKMDGADDGKTASENVDKDVHFSNEATIMPEQHETKINPKQSSPGDEEIMEDSPIMGVLTPKSEVGTRGSSLSETSVKKAIWRRADHFQANSQSITLAGVRRLLEEDLGLEKNTLYPFKKFISEEIDQVLALPEGDKSVKDVKKKASLNLKAKKLKNVSSEEGSDASHSESDEMEVKVKSRKGAASKINIEKSEQPKKRKTSEEIDLDNSGKKQNKPAKRQKEKKSPSEDGQSQSSLEKSAQRKEKLVSGYGKKVENLKSIIKACGMSVPPSTYKKAKQVPDEEREAIIVKELEGILSREGLSKNPTEKEIKDCKKRKDRARELEGIDMSNIISSSRRRSTFSFAAPVTPGICAKKDKIDAKDAKEDNNDKDHKDDSEEDDKENEKEMEEEEEKEKGKDDEDEDVAKEMEDDDEDEEEEEEEEDESEEFDEDDNEESD